MKKKFKTRIVHYSGNTFIIEYAHYYFIPNYRHITSPLFGEKNIWRDDEYLMKIEEAKQVIKMLKSFEDVAIIEQKIYDNEYNRYLKRKSLSYKL